MLLTRVLAALVFAPVLLAAVWFGGPWLLAAVLVLWALSLYEYLTLVLGKGELYLKAVTYVLGAVTVAGALGWLPATHAAALNAVFVPVALIAVMAKPDPIASSTSRAGLLVLGVAYAGLVLFLFHVRGLEGGRALAVMALFCTWASDTGAYFAGKAFGRHKLYPKISPGKTVEGLIGGLAAAVAIGFLIDYLLGAGLDPLKITGIGAIAALFGTAGDLSESMLKRSVGAKDSSKLIPGHGGVLDRFDAVMFVAPGVWVLASLWP